jgi:hypothetical protein
MYVWMMLTGSIILIFGICSVTSQPFHIVVTDVASIVIISVLPVLIYLIPRNLHNILEILIDIRRHQIEVEQNTRTAIVVATPSSCPTETCTPQNKCLTCSKTAKIGTPL